MKNIYLVGGAIVLLGMPGLLSLAAAAPPEILSTQEAAQVITVADVNTQGTTVSGVLINKSAEVVRDVRLLIRENWLWNDEYHPGSDDPGRAAFGIIPAEIPPHGRLPFVYEVGPLPQRTDGRFETFVEVVGFTEVGTGITSPAARANALDR